MKNPFRATRIFWGEMLTELKKASWPSKKELKDSTFIVLVGIALLGAYVAIVDFSLFQVVKLFTGWIQRIFGA